MMNTKSKTRRFGFTIIEIMIAVVILALSAAIAVPMFGNREDIVIAAASRKILADFQYAQNFAIATRQSIYVKFSADRYELCTLSSGTLHTITHPVEKDPFVVLFGASGDSNLQRVSLPLASIAGQAVLGFDSLGAPFAFDVTTQTRTSLVAVASISISSGATVQTLNIEPYTGEITVP